MISKCAPRKILCTSGVSVCACVFFWVPCVRPPQCFNFFCVQEVIKVVRLDFRRFGMRRRRRDATVAVPHHQQEMEAKKKHYTSMKEKQNATAKLNAVRYDVIIYRYHK